MSPEKLERLLRQLDKTLSIPEGRQNKAEAAYKGLGNWLKRPASKVLPANPQIYVQGSFRLGTVIRPFTNIEDYDLDLVCELKYTKTDLTQEALKCGLGREIRAYAESKKMQAPEEGRRCWTLHYADEAQFHIDTLPALPDGTSQRLSLERKSLDARYSDSAIAITDREDRHYRNITNNWPHSNPRGYGNWFAERMGKLFKAHREKLALDARSSVEKIPIHRVQTPLQAAIRILKHHRDQKFADDPDNKPISVIITTLAARCYGQQRTIAETLRVVLDNMENHIENRFGIAWIPNPTDSEENFADRWQTYPKRKIAFYSWLDVARRDFDALESTPTEDGAKALLRNIVGNKVIDTMLSAKQSTTSRLGTLMRKARQSINPAHKQKPPWAIVCSGSVTIADATYLIDGHRPQSFPDNGRALPKRASLIFTAQTSVAKPYKVFWQVVNTGEEATRANGLRGGFDKGDVSKGRLTRKESTLYRGAHTIECFIVKDELLAAKSGPFIVNIK